MKRIWLAFVLGIGVVLIGSTWAGENQNPACPAEGDVGAFNPKVLYEGADRTKKKTESQRALGNTSGAGSGSKK